MNPINAMDKLRRIETLFASAAADDASPQVIAALADADWHIVQAALQAICLCPGPAYVQPILAVLARQDKLDIYGQKDIDLGMHAGIPFAPKTNPFKDIPTETLDVWKCRWRVKQAACHALGAIGGRFGPQAVGAPAVKVLCGYTEPAKDEYEVRAAACQALGLIKDPAARDTLQARSQDREFCTATEAARALQGLDG